MISDVIKAVRSTRKQGSVTLNLKIAMLNTRTENQIKITPAVTCKVPELDREESIVFSTADGDVLFDDPNQIQIDLKTVPENKEKSVLKVVHA